MKKKAEIGIGTLIIFIAMILVAAIAAGVLLQTASSLQNKALLTGEKSKTQVSTSLTVLQLWAEDGQDGNAEFFCSSLKLQPGSDPIKLRELLVNMDTNDMSNDYLLGNRSTKTYTNQSETTSDFDFDGDGTKDNMILNSACDSLIIELSNGTNHYNWTVSLGTTLTGLGVNSKKNVTVYNAAVNLSSQQVGAISIFITNIDQNCTLDGSKGYIVGAGNNAEGAYYIDYSVKSASYVNGYLNRGDVIKLCLMAPRAIGEDEDISVTFVPKAGAVKVVETAMPEIFSQKRVYIYP